MKQATFTNKSDLIGATASFLCMVHCAATPFLFIASACSASCCAAAPSWWISLDMFFLLISFFAVRRTTKQITQSSTHSWIKQVLWLSWFLLMISVVLEQLSSIPYIHYLKYFSALSLIGFHLYNLVFCQCADEKCCINE